MSTHGASRFSVSHMEPSKRQVITISIEQFIAADISGMYHARHEAGGFIILQYPRLAMICAPDGSCVINAFAGTKIEAYVDDLAPIVAVA